HLEADDVAHVLLDVARCERLGVEHALLDAAAQLVARALALLDPTLGDVDARRVLPLEQVARLVAQPVAQQTPRTAPRLLALGVGLRDDVGHLRHSTPPVVPYPTGTGDACQRGGERARRRRRRRRVEMPIGPG